MSPRRKKSFFEKLTGTINLNNDYDDEYVEEDDFDDYDYDYDDNQSSGRSEDHQNDYPSEQSWNDSQNYHDEGELAVDVYQTPTHIVIQTMVAGVRPDDLDVSITREACKITGKREGPHNVASGDYFHQELYWGSFSREIMLPQEVEVDQAEAIENHGLLIIRLPKINKEQETKLQVKTGQ